MERCLKGAEESRYIITLISVALRVRVFKECNNCNGRCFLCVLGGGDEV